MDNPLAAAPVSFLSIEKHERPAPIGSSALVRIASEAIRRGYRIAHVSLEDGGMPLHEDDDVVSQVLLLLRSGKEADVQELLDEGLQGNVFVRFVELEDMATGIHLTIGRDGVLLLEGPRPVAQETLGRFVGLLNDAHGLIGLA